MIEDLKPLLNKLSIFAKERLGFSRPPKLFLNSDKKNANLMLGKTAQYDPYAESITLFIHNRHPKDVLRSYCHELVHHCQNIRGDLSPEKLGMMGKNYTQDNKHMRNMEKEAYLQGNMCFRDWEDGLENKEQYVLTIAEQKFLKESKNMSVKISKKDLKEIIGKILEQKTKGSCPRCKGKTSADGKCADKECRDSKTMEEAGCGGKAKRDTDTLEEIGEDLSNLKGGLKDYMESKAGKTSADAPMSVPADDDPPAKEGEKPDYSDIDNDGNKDESARGAAKDKNAKEKPDDFGDDSIDDYPLPSKGTASEGRIINPEDWEKLNLKTPEGENTLYESRFGKRNEEIFNKLKKLWTK